MCSGLVRRYGYLVLWIIMTVPYIRNDIMRVDLKMIWILGKLREAEIYLSLEAYDHKRSAI